MNAVVESLDVVLKSAITRAMNSGRRSLVNVLKEAHVALPDMTTDELLDWAERLVTATEEDTRDNIR